MNTLLPWHQTGEHISFNAVAMDGSSISSQKIFVKHLLQAHKPVLLLIHGFPTSSYDWQPLWSQLSEHFSLITLDMLGYGLSDKPTNARYSLRDQADLVEFVLAKYKIQQCHILAHDYGDTVAQELLARHNQLQMTLNINSCILLNGGIFPEATRPILIQKLLATPIGAIIAKFMTFKDFNRSFDRICGIPLTEIELKQHWQLMQYNQGKKVFHVLIRYMNERKQNRQRWTEALQHFSPPLRLINGIEDPISGQSIVDRFDQLIKDADTVELQQIGHYPQIEAPEKVLQHAVSFWKKHHIIT